MGVTLKTTGTAPGAKPPRVKKEAPVQSIATEVVDVPAKELKAVAKKPTTDKPETKKSELAAVIAAIKKTKGDKVAFIGRDIPNVERMPTGDFEFDFYTGGGFPKGRISIIYGPESSCKTTMALRAAAIVQKGPPECNKVVFIDVENALDSPRAEELGVDIDELIVVRPRFGEEAADLVLAFIAAEDVALVIIDSIAAIISTGEVDKSLEKFDVGTSAILIKRMTNKINNLLLTEATRDHFPGVIMINQIRYKVGVMFGNPETTPGGKAPHFMSALTVRVAGNNKIVKEVNPDKPSFKELNFQIIKAKVGIIRSQWTMDMAMIPAGDLLPGETNSWNMVKGELQAAGLLAENPNGKGWLLDGKVYPKQEVIKDTYYAEADFALHLQQMVIKNYTGKMTIFDDTKSFLAQDGVQVNEGDGPPAGGTALFGNQQ